jgi:hypothetical protein
VNRPLGPLRAAALALTVVTGVGISTAPAGAAVDPFYTSLLLDGRMALSRRDFTNAVKDLRTASFGLLDEPAALAESLVLLAIAQGENGAETGFRETFGRLLEVEQRFTVYDATPLDPAERKRFQDLARERIAAPVLASAPAFARWSKAEEKPAKPTRTSRRRDQNQPAKPADAAAHPPTAPPAPPTLPPLETPVAPRTPVPPAPVTVTSPTEAELGALASAQARMDRATALADLTPAIETAFPIADRYPTAQTAQRLAMELAYRSSRWSDVVRFAARVPIEPAVDPALCFYVGVAEAELGRREVAASWLRRCAAYLERTPVVLRYLDLLD